MLLSLIVETFVRCPKLTHFWAGQKQRSVPASTSAVSLEFSPKPELPSPQDCVFPCNSRYIGPILPLVWYPVKGIFVPKRLPLSMKLETGSSPFPLSIENRNLVLMFYGVLSYINVFLWRLANGLIFVISYRYTQQDFRLEESGLE